MPDKGRDVKTHSEPGKGSSTPLGDWTRQVTARCLFCTEKVIGRPRYMSGGHYARWRYRDLGIWNRKQASFEKVPEFFCLWNGVNGQDIFLCPKHSSDAHYKRAMQWAVAQSKKGIIDWLDPLAILVEPLRPLT